MWNHNISIMDRLRPLVDGTDGTAFWLVTMLVMSTVYLLRVLAQSECGGSVDDCERYTTFYHILCMMSV